MNRKLLILALVAVMVALVWPGRPTQANPPKGDFCLFTTEKTGTVADDFVTVTADKEGELHLTGTNFDNDENRINIVFADGDSILIRVLVGESFSFTHVIGTNPGVDDVIKIDPLDQDGDVSPMVGWISIHREEEGAKVGCRACPAFS